MYYEKDLTALYSQIEIKNRKKKVNDHEFWSWMIKNSTNNFNNFGKDKFPWDFASISGWNIKPSDSCLKQTQVLRQGSAADFSTKGQ